MDNKKAFEIIEARAQGPRPLPSLSKKTDGFTRTDVANAFQHAFQMIGGVQRLALWANENPDKFYPLYSKLLPGQALVIGDVGQLTLVHAIGPTALDDHPTSRDTVQMEPVDARTPE
jgi:hypothetical protein